MKYKTLLVTGGAGFVGSNLAVSFKNKYPGLKVIALDNLKRRGSELNLSRLRQGGIEFIHGDIRNPEDLDLEKKIDLLIECSAEPSVLAGYGRNHAYVINTNFLGTINCLELARRNHADVIFLSTSRVYPYGAINKIKVKEAGARFVWASGQKIAGWSEKGINTDFTTSGPKTLYGATKLASELALADYIETFGLKGVVNRCGVIAGPWQFGKADQGVFTFWLLAHYFKKKINYIGFKGKGKQVRDLLHISDLFTLIDLEAKNLNKINGRVYNVGGGKEISLSLRETTKICQEITGNRISIGSSILERPGDIIIYLTDNAKVKKELSWEPKRSPEEILADTYRWIRKNERQLEGALL